MFLDIPDPDPLFKGTDTQIRIRIRTKMPQIRNTATYAADSESLLRGESA
jgi:hypothetical protein